MSLENAQLVTLSGTTQSPVGTTNPLPVTISGGIAQSAAKYISIDTTSNTVLVAAVSGKRIRVLAFAVSAIAAETVALWDNTNSVPIIGSMPLAANGVLVLPYNPVGWGQSGVGGSVQVIQVPAPSSGLRGCLVYVEVG